MSKCVRCHEPFGNRQDGKCVNCHVHKDRPVRRIRRKSKIGGKHGRNSGKVSQHGKRGGAT